MSVRIACARGGHGARGRRALRTSARGGLVLAGVLLARGLGAEPLWEAGAGAAALSLPDYRGSDERRAYLLPFPYFVYRGERLRADREGVRAKLFNDDRWDLDVSAGANFAIRSEGNRARADMPRLHPWVEIGPELVYHVIGQPRSAFSLDARGALRAVFAVGGGRVSAEGVIANPYLRARWRNLGGLDLSASLGVQFADRQHHDYLYGVAPAYATAERPAYAARGGYGGWQASLGASRRYGDLWIGGYVRLDSLGGAVFESSPLVRTRRYAAAGIAVAWVFGKSTLEGRSDD